MKNYLTRRNNEGGLFGDFFDGFDNFFAPAFYPHDREMRTDVKETENGYEVKVDMPGFEKKDISLELKDGYITLSANREEKEENGKYVRRERKMSVSRSFYVGNDIKEEDVKAKYENGTLTFDIPKKEEKKPESGRIAIE